MGCGGGTRCKEPLLLHQGHELGRKGGERRQAAAKTRYDEEAPLQREGRVRRKERDGEADDVAADEVGGERTGGIVGKRLLSSAPSHQRRSAPELAPIEIATTDFHMHLSSYCNHVRGQGEMATLTVPAKA
jgi:hypothetical protein